MRLSIDWLAEYGISCDAETLAHRLTMAGLEVDEVIAAAPAFNKIVIGEVRSLEAHPDADKLRVAQVDVGEEELLQIVCGAPNVAEGAKVPTALIGANLPGDFKIKKSKLRGVASHGMLCSARELGISEDHSGLMILPADAPVGEDIRDYLRLNDTILDIDLTPNRADGFSMRGLAREAAVLLEQEADLTLAQLVDGVNPASISVHNEVPQACPVYLARQIKGIDLTVETPLWLQERLRRLGVRPHDPVVDVTNYVMMSLGAPMHAFDAAKIDGNIVVRFAKAGETLELLNEQRAELADDVLLIADEQKPLAVAGVMGGANSACSETTRDIVLEAAWFDPLVIAGKARRFALASDSAQRFERGVDYTIQQAAMALATQLISEICGGEVYEVVTDQHAEHLPQREKIALRREAIGKRIGRSYDDAQVVDILRRLGCQVADVQFGWSVTPPTWRFDLAIEEDLIEEVVRVNGYDQVEAVVPVLDYRPREAQNNLSSHTEKLLRAGFYEAITYSFIDQDSHQAFFPDAPIIPLQNPISATLAEMRLSLLPGLVNALAYNRNRQQQDLRLFETGKVFIPQGEKAVDCVQETRVAGVMSGREAPEQWSVEPRAIDFYDVKAVVENLLDGRGDYQPTKQHYLHPGKGADVFIDGQYVGCIGALHPALRRSLGIKGSDIWVFELNTAALIDPEVSRFQALNKYPSVRRDLALVLDQSVAAAAIAKVVNDSVGELLADQFFFDQYEGERLGENKKSLALAIVLQDKDKTLQDEEVERIIANLVAQFKRSFNAELR
ncbi:phenylalanine--tRNA ligase subunit beta [Suttonella sp. R2A3]|uniref:phenylalanine--tRNA ligase subunit beta n=1 Tax=Suttonella sp. R2A3 TaxID=2908648 RepID=UPI001F30FED2|nr:phenylalanine--tRNA ligase subunit beta [Suttonella sp. R2A3]UJF24474.1 phenylalanine--tRNA ligase subunit beta [Suttonella sp. R2A3]